MSEEEIKREKNQKLHGDEEKYNKGDEEYQESYNQENEEDTQEFKVAFDIQRNEGAFILLIGKTEENKLILRLIEKDDESKPFYQNDFSLEEIKELNSDFQVLKNEDELIDLISKNLNEHGKDMDIEILDENNLKIKMLIYIKDNKLNIEFILNRMEFLPEYDGKEEKETKNDTKKNNNNNININLNEEGIIEEELENINEENKEEINFNDEKIDEENLEYSEENNENSNQKNINHIENLPLQIDSNRLNFQHLQNNNIIYTNDEQNHILDKRDDGSTEKKLLTDTKISKVIEELKDNLDSFGGAMNYITQEEQGYKDNEKNEDDLNKIKFQNEEHIPSFKNQIIKILNEQMQKQNDYIKNIKSDIQRENAAKINELKNEIIKLQKNNNANLKPQSNYKYNVEEMNQIKNNIKNIYERMNNLDRQMKQNEKNIYIINSKISNLESKFKTIENQGPEKKYKLLEDKINKCNNALNNIKLKDDNLNNMMTKINNINQWTQTFEADFKNLEKKIETNYYNIEELEKKFNKFTNKKPNNQNELAPKGFTFKRDNDRTSSNDGEGIYIKLKKQKLNDISINKDNSVENTNNKMNSKRRRVYESLTYNHDESRSSVNTSKPFSEKVKDFKNIEKPRSRSKERKSEDAKEIVSDKILHKKYKSNYNKPSDNDINKSNIIQTNEINFILDRLKEISPNNKKQNIKFHLIYRATEDGDKALNFHEKCDKIGPNITFILTSSNFIFGGFTMKNWEHLKRDINENKPNLGSASRDAKAFGFCVNYQKIYNNERPNEFAIWCNRNYGPTFKNNFFQIFDNCLTKGGYCSSRNHSYFGGQESDYEISGGEYKFDVEEIEVFEVEFV